MHFYLRSDDGINGISVLKYASRAVELSNYVENTALDFYAKSGMTTGLLKSKVPMLGKQATEAMALVSGEVNTTKSNNLIKFLPYILKMMSRTRIFCNPSYLPRLLHHRSALHFATAPYNHSSPYHTPPKKDNRKYRYL